MDLHSAAANLKQGYLVAFPTETVYGLGADAENPQAIQRMYEVKGRPTNHPVIVHIGDVSLLGYWAKDIPDYAMKLVRKFWPGPMTLLLPRTTNASDAITGGQEVVGVRIPSHPIALELLQEFHRIGGHGVVAPSANRFGKVSPTTAEAVREELSSYLTPQDLILDGGDSEVGIESTIIDCTGNAPQILRLGAITPEMIVETCGLSMEDSARDIRFSGGLAKHYSPRAVVVMDERPQKGEGLIAFSEIDTPTGAIRLASPKNVEEFAHQLYSALRKADSLNLARVCVYLPQGDGLASAIRDRVTRASSQG